jgi:CDP-diacylglycerol--serine O-phosphatidyltransferase
MKKHIPNFITSLNLLSGCFGIGFVFGGNVIMASYLIGIAAIFDLLDGMVARLLNVKSEFGKQLDSLADLISFGLLPGIILYSLLKIAFNDAEGFQAYLPFIAFLIPLFSALRLAKFNIDDKQAESFIGLPTPANAIFIASIPLILIQQNETVISNLFGNPGFIIFLVLVLSFLLVAPIPLFSMKFKDLSWAKNYIRYIFIILSVILFIIFYFQAIPIIILLYILLSIINNSVKK